MDEASVNPLIVILLFLLRCLAPLAFLLGLSYLLRRLGLISDPTPPPADRPNGDVGVNANSTQGGGRHG